MKLWIALCFGVSLLEQNETTILSKRRIQAQFQCKSSIMWFWIEYRVGICWRDCVGSSLVCWVLQLVVIIKWYPRRRKSGAKRRMKPSEPYTKTRVRKAGQLLPKDSTASLIFLEKVQNSVEKGIPFDTQIRKPHLQLGRLRRMEGRRRKQADWAPQRNGQQVVSHRS